MARDLISKTTRNEFREQMVGFTLHQIEMMFDAGDLKPDMNHAPSVRGERRTLVEQYYAAIDFKSPKHIKQLLAVYAELIHRLDSTHVGNPEALELTIEGLLDRMERDGFVFGNGLFVPTSPLMTLVGTETVLEVTEASVIESIDKAGAKIEAGDSAGAIASAYTLVEQLLKLVLDKAGAEYKENEGDIRALYKIAKEALNLNPAGEGIESSLKPILSGLQNLVSGLYEVANKASDRHARRYNPAPHHAKLAVNTAFALCVFLVESHAYQQDRKAKHAS